MWKENVMKYLESGSLSYITVGEFLLDLKKEFGNGDNKTAKVAELKKIEQRNKIIEFVQEFRRAVRKSGYEKRLLIEKFKREINGVIRRNLIEVEYSSGSIE